MHINLCGGDRFVTEHSLDGSEVGSAFEQTSGKAVAKGVGRDCFVYACLLNKVANDVEHHNAGELFFLTETEEYIVFVSWFYVDVATVIEPEFQFFDGSLTDGYKSLFVTLSFYFYETLVEV